MTRLTSPPESSILSIGGRSIPRSSIGLDERNKLLHLCRRRPSRPDDLRVPLPPNSDQRLLKRKHRCRKTADGISDIAIDVRRGSKSFEGPSVGHDLRCGRAAAILRNSLGTNGSGKTTTIACSALLTPTARSGHRLGYEYRSDATDQAPCRPYDAAISMYQDLSAS